jgi:hypothetical protein
LEGTGEYKALADFVLKNIPDLEEKINGKLSLYGDVNGGLSAETKLYEAQTELVADFMGEVLTKPDAVERIIRANKSVALRIYDWIKGKLTGKSLGKAESELYKTAERMFAAALKTGTGGVALSEIERRNGGETLAERQEKEYNIKTEGVKNGERIENQARYSIERGKENDRHGVEGRDGEKESGGQGAYNSDRDKRGRRTVSVSTDAGGIQRLSEIARKNPGTEINSFAKEVYTKPETETQEAIAWHAKNEDIAVYFVKPRQNAVQKYVYKNNEIFLDENATEKDFADILNHVKPIKRSLDPKKIAHISEERYARFLRWQPDAFLTRIPIQDFLNMTTADYVEQRQLNARSLQISKKVGVEAIKSVADEMYLTIDFKTGKVVDHEGRHRMTALLNAGNMYADVFVLPKNKPDYQSKVSLIVTGQFNDNKYDIGVVRANSEKFREEIRRRFRTDDGNIRYSLPDTDSAGRKLTPEQREFFKDSKVIDGQGRLLEVYHGTKVRGKKFNSFNSHSNWFTPNRGYADVYADDREFLGKPTIYKAYLNIKNPFYAGAIGVERDVSYKVADIAKKIDVSEQELITIAKEVKATYVFEITNSRQFVDLLKQKGYDGIAAIEAGVESYAAFEPNQVKSVDNKTPTADPDIRYSLASETETRGAEAYSYKTLTSKPDMKVTRIYESVPKTDDGKINRAGIIRRGIANAKAQGNPKNTDTQTYLYVNDIDRNVILGYSSLSHGLGQNLDETAKVLLKIGEILSNSISLNELNGRIKGGTNVEMSYVLLGYALDQRNNAYIARIVVDKLTDEVSGFETYRLSAVRAKEKTGRIRSPEKSVADEAFQSSFTRQSVISIRELLENVKDIPLINEVFSSDVAKKLGVERASGALTDSVRYSLKDEADGVAVSADVKDAAKTSADLLGNKTMRKGYAKAAIYAVMKKSGFTLADALDREGIIEYLTDNLNASTPGNRNTVAKEVAAAVINAASIKNVYESEELAADAKAAIAAIRPYLHKMSLGSIKADIVHRYGKKSAGGIMLSWGSKDSRLTPDKVAQELEESGVHIEAESSADIFFEILEKYRGAKAALSSSANKLVTDVYGDEELTDLLEVIAGDVLNAFEKYGDASFVSSFFGAVEKSRDRQNFAIAAMDAEFQAKTDLQIAAVDSLKAKFTAMTKSVKYKAGILDGAVKARELVKRKFPESAGIAYEQQIKEFMTEIARFKRGYEISGAVREHVAKLGKMYTPKNRTLNAAYGEVAGEADKASDFIDSLDNDFSSKTLSAVVSSPRYAALDDAGKAYALRFIEDYYYTQAVGAVLKIDIASARQSLAALIPVDALAVYLAYISALSSDKDATGKTVAGSLKNKVLSYIKKLPLTAKQKSALIEALGYQN